MSDVLPYSDEELDRMLGPVSETPLPVADVEDEETGGGSASPSSAPVFDLTTGRPLDEGVSAIEKAFAESGKKYVEKLEAEEAASEEGLGGAGLEASRLVREGILRKSGGTPQVDEETPRPRKRVQSGDVGNSGRVGKTPMTASGFEKRLREDVDSAQRRQRTAKAGVPLVFGEQVIEKEEAK